MSSQEEPVKKKKKENPHEDHRDRMRARFRKNGFEGFSDHEILEMLLYYVYRRHDTNVIAHALLDKFHSLDAVMHASREELMEVKGIGEKSAFLVEFLRAFMQAVHLRKIPREPLNTFDTRCRYYFDLLWAEVDEVFLLTCLDDKLRVLHTSEIARGTPGSVTVGKIDIVRKVINTKCNTVMIAHNHPLGPPLPSHEDIMTTSIIAGTLKELGLSLEDHIIVGDGRAISMKESGCFIP